jgi:hypothetical protein
MLGCNVQRNSHSCQACEYTLHSQIQFSSQIPLSEYSEASSFTRIWKKYHMDKFNEDKMNHDPSKYFILENGLLRFIVITNQAKPMMFVL